MIVLGQEHGATIEQVRVRVVSVDQKDFGNVSAPRPALDMNDNVERVSDIGLNGLGGATWHETFENWGLGGWPEGAAKSNWKELAASLNADHIQAPLLVNGSDSEYIASLALYTSLEQLKKPVDLFVYAHELHIKNQPTHRYEIYERNLDWFRFWLSDEEDPSPDKASQFKYWRQLRQESHAIVMSGKRAN
jgi:hypothetical protein